MTSESPALDASFRFAWRSGMLIAAAARVPQMPNVGCRTEGCEAMTIWDERPWTVGPAPWEVEGPVIDVESDAWGLIVLRATGVWYSAQAGGGACLQVCAEGVFQPLSDTFKQSDSLIQYCAQGGCQSGRLTHEDANFIDALLAKNLFMKKAGLRVDRDSLHISTEAWVHVVLGDLPERYPSPAQRNAGAGHALAYGFGKSKAILTWPNSD